MYQTESIEVEAENGEKITLIVPTNPFVTCFGRPITDEVRKEMSDALDKATAGGSWGWKSKLQVRVENLQEVKVLSEAAEFFQAADTRVQICDDGIGYMVSSDGYQAN